MKRLGFFIIAAIVCSMPALGDAAGFDGSAPLLCAFTRASECTEADGCRDATFENVNLPRFVKIDVQKKLWTTLGESGRTTTIQSVKELDDKLIMQGAEEAREGVRDGVGWSAAIMEDSGNLVLTGSGDDVAFIIFGVCTTL
ncbi:MAG: hypothetical protein ACM3ON_01595 [Chloroflexota bacterium]